MKRLLLIPLLVLTLLTFASCGEEQSSATPAAATVDQAEQDDAPRKVVATRPPNSAETTVPEEDTTAADTTQDTTAQQTTRPDPSKIPADNITSANINPNIGGIQSWVISEMNSLEMTELSVDTGSVTLKKGESTEVGISILRQGERQGRDPDYRRREGGKLRYHPDLRQRPEGRADRHRRRGRGGDRGARTCCRGDHRGTGSHRGAYGGVGCIIS